MTFKIALTLSICCTFAIGCGRSQLLAEGGPLTTGSGGGDGGQGGDGGSPMGGGGQGGEDLDCSTLAVEGPVGVAGGMNANQRQPALVNLSSDIVAMAMEWTDAGFPGAPREVRHTSFPPWGPDFLTADVAPSFLGDFDRGESLRITTSTNNRFALLMKGPLGPGQALAFNPFFSAASGAIGSNIVFGGADRVAFASHDGAGRFLLGWSRMAGPGTALVAATVQLDPNTDQFSIVNEPQPLGCSPGPVVGDAQWTGERWVVVTATGVPNGPTGCAPGPPPPGPPEFMQAQFVDQSGNVTFTGSEFTTPIDRLELVAVDTGHYALWTGVGDGFGGPVFALRLDEGGELDSGVFTLEGTDDAVVGGDWDAGRFGDGFLLTWRSGADGATHALRFDDNAGPLGEVVMPTQAVGRPEVLGDPSGDTAALVAYPSAGGQADQMQLHRVRCP
jgi:hypothetical protein